MKRLARIVGRHRWTTVIERGESYRVCSACGKIPKGPRSGPRGSGAVETPGEGGSPGAP